MSHRYILLARPQQGAAIAVCNLGAIDAAHVPVCAEVARNEGFALMYECSSPPDMQEVQQRIHRGEPLVGMDTVVQLWVLQPENLRR